MIKFTRNIDPKEAMGIGRLSQRHFVDAEDFAAWASLIVPHWLNCKPEEVKNKLYWIDTKLLPEIIFQKLDEYVYKDQIGIDTSNMPTINNKTLYINADLMIQFRDILRNEYNCKEYYNFSYDMNMKVQIDTSDIIVCNPIIA